MQGSVNIAEVWLMSNSAGRFAYKNWFNSSFTGEEINLLSSIGVECKADHNFFKFEILDIAFDIKNYKLKKYPSLYEKFVDRYIQINPRFLHSQIDRELLKEDHYYAAWFFNRHCFLEDQKKAKETALNNSGSKFDRVYVLWSPCDDMHCPKECLLHKNMIYHVLDEEFIEHSVDHWMTIKRGCRCCLISLTESNVRDKISKGQYVLSKNLRARFSHELMEAKRNMKTFSQVAYDLAFGRFPYYHLYNPENFYSDSDAIKDYCLRELQIIVESLDVVKDTHHLDTAQSRLDLARNKLEIIRQQAFIFDKTTFEAITSKLIVEFKKAHTCVYTNIFNVHIRKSDTVKRQSTKDKYLTKAREVVEAGLTDQLSDKYELNKLLSRLNKAP